MKEQLIEFWSKRNPREKVLLAGLSVFLVFMIGWPAIVQPIAAAFAKQRQELEEVNLTYTAAPDILARYAKLTARRNSLEKFYSKIDVSANPYSHLERLIRDTAKASGGYTVNKSDEKQIGGKYLHRSFTVNFQSTSLEDVAAFLKELTTGPQPMLVTQINLDRRATASTLNVSLEVTGFESLTKGK